MTKLLVLAAVLAGATYELEHPPGETRYFTIVAEDAAGFTAAWAPAPAERAVVAWQPGDPVFPMGRVGVELADGYLCLHPGSERKPLAPKFPVGLDLAGLLRIEVHTRPPTSAEVAAAYATLGIPPEAVLVHNRWVFRADDAGDGDAAYSAVLLPGADTIVVHYPQDGSMLGIGALAVLRTDAAGNRLYPPPDGVGTPLLITHIMAYYPAEED